MAFTNQVRRRTGSQGLNNFNLLRQAAGRTPGFGEIDYSGTMHPAFGTGEAQRELLALAQWMENPPPGRTMFRSGMPAGQQVVPYGTQQSGIPSMPGGGDIPTLMPMPRTMFRSGMSKDIPTPMSGASPTGMLPGVSAPGLPPGIMQAVLASSMGSFPPLQAGPNLAAQTQAYMPRTYGDFSPPPQRAPLQERMGQFVSNQMGYGNVDPAGPYSGLGVGGPGGGLARFQALAAAEQPGASGPNYPGPGERFGTSVTVQMPDGRIALMPYVERKRDGNAWTNDELLDMLAERSVPNGQREGDLRSWYENTPPLTHAAQDQRMTRTRQASEAGTAFRGQSPSQLSRALLGTMQARGEPEFDGNYDEMLAYRHSQTLNDLAQRRQDLRQQRQQFLDEVSPELRRERFLSRQANAALRRRALQEAAPGGQGDNAAGEGNPKNLKRPLSLSVRPGTEGGPSRTQQIVDVLHNNMDAELTMEDLVGFGFTPDEVAEAEAELRSNSVLNSRGGMWADWTRDFFGMEPSARGEWRERQTRDINRLRKITGNEREFSHGTNWSLW